MLALRSSHENRRDLRFQAGWYGARANRHARVAPAPRLHAGTDRTLRSFRSLAAVRAAQHLCRLYAARQRPPEPFSKGYQSLYKLHVAWRFRPVVILQPHAHVAASFDSDLREPAPNHIAPQYGHRPRQPGALEHVQVAVQPAERGMQAE